ncbi:MAG: DUF58 domain-containing protein [Candidatus Dependentiae bacterium]
MVSKDVRKRIRQIEIHTKRLLRGSLVGQSSSAVKGSGLEFDQIREYQQGDDVRYIDWKSSARMDKLMIRQYIEERSRSIVLAVDISGSSFFSSGVKTKYQVMQEVAAVIALAGEMAKDRIGLLLFSDEVELFIPPNSGQKHVRYLLEQLFSYAPKRKKTSVTTALEYVAKFRIKDAVVFLISDFISPSFEKALSIVAKRYELIAVRCLDKNEREMPRVGFLPMVDDETGVMTIVNLGSKKARVNRFCHERLLNQNRIFSTYGIDLLEVKIAQPYIQEMVRFFKKRMLY